MYIRIYLKYIYTPPTRQVCVCVRACVLVCICPMCIFPLHLPPHMEPGYISSVSVCACARAGVLRSICIYILCTYPSLIRMCVHMYTCARVSECMCSGVCEYVSIICRHTNVPVTYIYTTTYRHTYVAYTALHARRSDTLHNTSTSHVYMYTQSPRNTHTYVDVHESYSCIQTPVALRLCNRHGCETDMSLQYIRRCNACIVCNTHGIPHTCLATSVGIQHTCLAIHMASNTHVLQPVALRLAFELKGAAPESW